MLNAFNTLTMAPLKWIQNNFPQLTWVDDHKKYGDHIVTAPIYCEKTAKLIAKFFQQNGMGYTKVGQSQEKYFRVFLTLSDIRDFIFADKMRDGRCLTWDLTFEAAVPMEDLQVAHQPKATINRCASC